MPLPITPSPSNSGHRPRGGLDVRADFGRTEFGRRRRTEILGTIVSLGTAEDLVVAKLAWAKAGDSALQLRDAAAIVHAQGTDLDRSYLEEWVSELGLDLEWEQVKTSAP